MSECSGGSPRRDWRFFLAIGALILVFSHGLVRWAMFAASSDLYSHVLLIPVISAYLIWIEKGQLADFGDPDKVVAISCSAAAAVLLTGYGIAFSSGVHFQTADSLALVIPSFVLLLWAVCAWFLGPLFIRSIGFQLVFLILMSPMPVFFRSMIESQLQHYSALCALGFFEIAGTPVYYTDLKFQLSDISLQVAPECSGIHSSVALFVVSLVAGKLFLRSNWKRGILALAVLPLAILRNGFRVFTIGELCVHIGPEMIDSKIHHKGGPIFFALSLVPFLFLLFLLVRSERKAAVKQPLIKVA